jgi:hypothetical protein
MSEAVYVLAPRVRPGEWFGSPWEPRTVAASTLSRIFEREGSPWVAASLSITSGGR